MKRRSDGSGRTVVDRKNSTLLTSVEGQPNSEASSAAVSRRRGHAGSEGQGDVSTWWWVLVGTGLYFVLSVLVGLAIAAILGQIGREIPELFEGEDWASAPLAREMGKEAEEEA